MKNVDLLKAICLSGIVCGAVYLQASTTAHSSPLSAAHSLVPPTLLSDGFVTNGVDSPDLLRAVRDAIVNETLVQINKKPFYLTSLEKARPGGFLAVATEPGDGGLMFQIYAHAGKSDLGIPSSLDIRVSVPKKVGVSEDEMARRIAKVNAESRLKVFAEADVISIQTVLHLPEVTTWNHISRVTCAHLVTALFFAVENAKSDSPVVMTD